MNGCENRFQNVKKIDEKLTKSCSGSGNKETEVERRMRRLSSDAPYITLQTFLPSEINNAIG